MTNVMGNYGQQDSSTPPTVSDQLIVSPVHPSARPVTDIRPTSMSVSGVASAKIVNNKCLASAFGLSLYACTTILYRTSGGIYNPSVTLALLLSSSIKPCRFMLIGAAQMIGGIAANAILLGLTTGEMQASRPQCARCE